MSRYEQTLNLLEATPYQIGGSVNVVFVADPTTAFYKEVQRINPDGVFSTLSDAINVLVKGDGSSTFGYNRSRIIVQGSHTVTSQITVPNTLSGITIEFLPGAELTTATALGANTGVLEIQADDCTLINPVIKNSQATQTGDGLIIGDAAGGSGGDAKRCKIIGGVIGGYTTGTDFINAIQVRDGEGLHIKGTTVYGSTATTEAINIVAGIGNGKDYTLEDVNVKIVTGGADTHCLAVAADQVQGKVIGGSYIVDSGAPAVEITADGWSLLGGGLAANTDAVGAGAQIDFVTTTTFYIGQFFVKQIGGATAASLFDEANV